MILFIHGFNSSSECQKCLLLKQNSKDVTIPSLDLLDVNTSLARLEQIIDTNIDLIMGASFGGFYAHYLAKKYKKDLILINPLLEPLNLIQEIELGDTNHEVLIDEITKMREFNALHTFEKEVEVLFGLDDVVIDPLGHSSFFSAHSCKFYKDDHRLIKGFDDYLRQRDTLLTKYL